VKVGDLVREVGLQERTGVIVEVVKGFEHHGAGAGAKAVYKVLWNKMTPTSPTMVGGAWFDQLEVISEGR
tara:strand:- start:357 stop:566 length:210 start_codon:yes stop_codon:yes gene_type:complete